MRPSLRQRWMVLLETLNLAVTSSRVRTASLAAEASLDLRSRVLERNSMRAERSAGEGVVGVVARGEAGDAEVDEVPGVGFVWGGVDEEVDGGAELLGAF